MATKKVEKQPQEITISALKGETVTFCLLGITPMIHHRVSVKTARQLLLPSGPKTKADKQMMLKHTPLEEYRECLYQYKEPDTPALFFYPAGAFKKAIMNAALDMPGSTKSQIGRLVHVEGTNVPIYGKTQLHMSITRQSGMTGAPDVTTRAIMPEWATQISVTYQSPILREASITNLLAAAGINSGMGDYRPQKGAGNFGQFMIVDPDDANFLRVLKQGRKVQQESLENPECYDQEAEDMLAWFDAEVRRRGFKVA